MIRVTIFQNKQPQFYATFKRQDEATDYITMWRGLAARAGILISHKVEDMG